MFNRLKSYFPKNSSISWVALCFTLFLVPTHAFGGDGVLGGHSIASSQLILVIPEVFKPTDIRVEEEKLVSCGNFASDITFLGLHGSMVQPVELKNNDLNCKQGQEIVIPSVGNGLTIIVPSSVF